MQGTGVGGVGAKTGRKREGVEGDRGINMFDFPGLLGNGISFRQPYFLPLPCLGMMTEGQLREEIRNQQQCCTDTGSKLGNKFR